MIVSSTSPGAIPAYADVCIVGAGAAGITLALELSATGKVVCLLEAGQWPVVSQAQTADAYRGQVTLPPEWVIPDNERVHFDNYLHTSRLRFLGGTTNHWEGFCRPLSPHIFAGRHWIPGSQWPFTADTLTNDYQRACALLRISPFVKTHDIARDGWIENAGVQTHLYYHSPPVRFGEEYRHALTESHNIHVITDATVTQLRCGNNARVASEVDIASTNGQHIQLKAGVFVLACGGIENARMLLLSDEQHAAGMGNSSGNVGRHFMDHFMVYVAGNLAVDATLALNRYTRIADPLSLPRQPAELERGHSISAVLTLSPAVQQQYQLNDTAWYVYPQKKLNHTPNQTVRDVATLAAYIDGHAGDNDGYDLAANCESTPHPDSRVTLSDVRDSYGCRRAELDWHVYPQDVERVMHATRILGAQLASTSIGRVRAMTLNSGERYPYVMPEGHHCGTTRMSTTPQDGVVNADCRLHDVDNVYVAGSSVFPSIGYANPTLTIVALAVRLARHLREHIS